MIRFSSQLVFCSPQQILRRTVIEQNEKNTITRIFSLDESIAESAQTLFFNGIISSEIVSIKQSLTEEINVQLKADYQYLDLSVAIPVENIIPSGKPLILDFGSNNTDEINWKFSVLASILVDFSIVDIIAAVTYYPAIIAGKTNAIQVNNSIRLLLWENIDFSNNRLMEKTRIRFLS